MALGNSPIFARIRTLPQLFGALGCLSIFLSTTVGANASQLVCRKYSVKDATELLETIKISISESDQVSVWKRQETTSYLPEKEEYKKVIAHWMSRQGGSGAKFSVVAIEERFVDKARLIDETYPPTIFFIDWGKAKLAEIIVPFTYDPPAYVNTRWECSRLD